MKPTRCRNLTVFIILVALFTIPVAVPGAKAADYSEVTRDVPTQWRDDVTHVLDLASVEWNDGELISALQYYPSGTAKHRAVCFLIANMDKHLYVEYIHTEDPMNPFSPEDESGEWLREYIYDYSTMSADLLIENVEWAFKAREEFPWCRNLPENVFFQYVLPYRSTQEPVHSWRPEIYTTYSPLIAGLSNALVVTEAVNIYNASVFSFDSLYYRHPEDRDIPTLLSCGKGRCEDMSNLSNYSLRALGVPTTSDFTPYWPKGDNNHAWNAVYYQGQWYAFMGCEPRTDPVYDSIKSSDFAKVYRKSFSAEPIMGRAPDGTEPPRLMRTTAIDVTAEYSTVDDIEIDISSPSPAIYLCVHNFAEWQAVGGAWADGDTVRFPDVGNHDILYCATYYVENEFGWGNHYPVAPPFVLHRDGSIEYINPCPESEPVGDINVTGWTGSNALDDGVEVTLFRYVGCDDPEAVSPMEWKAVGTVTTATDGGSVKAVFTGAAMDGGLYVLSDKADEVRDNSRPFIYRQSDIVYY